ncbi:MAG: hypothetical protein NWR83_12035 [Salibacteraceae bacterium]|jgi:hypothetical protein|nr:hypothetical protein [Salibacteraceae bacterium]MDP4845191.1 hypothetical protein [Salibacteraceae bacterium]
MSTFLIETDTESNIQALADYAKKLGIKFNILNTEEVEDFKLGQLMQAEKTNVLVEEDKVLYQLKKK